jgi:hypothetical protein
LKPASPANNLLGGRCSQAAGTIGGNRNFAMGIEQGRVPEKFPVRASG